MKKYICLLLGALMLVSALSGCGGKEDDEGGSIVRACVCAPIAALDPALNTDADAETVFRALYENLMRTVVDEEGGVTVEPAVAREYEVVENYDGTVDYLFTLRSSARWSDGTRVKARDFVYAWRRLANPATGSPNAELLSVVQGYDAVRESGDATQLAVRTEGESTFCVTLSRPCAYFLSDVCTAVATMPLRSDAANKDPDWAASGKLLSNGPYRLSVWVKGESLYLRRNDDYYESRTVLPDTLRFLFAKNAAQVWRRYTNGLADYISNPPPGTEGAEILPLRSTVCLFYNHMSDVFSNAHMRRAFDLSLDRAAVAAAGAWLTPATGLVPRGVSNDLSENGGDFRTAGGELIAVDEEGYPERCAEAGEELRLSGFSSGAEQPEVTCIYVAEEGMRPVAEAAAELWETKLGFPVLCEGLTRAEFDLCVASGEYELAIDTLRTDCGDAMDFLAPFAGLDADNALHYVSRPYDLLIGVARSSGDVAARTAMLHDAESLLLEDTAISPLCFGGKGCLLRPGLSGVRHDVRGSAYFTAVTATEETV